MTEIAATPTEPTVATVSDIVGEVDATARLAAMKSDKVLVERYLSGEVSARKEFADVHAAMHKAAPDPSAVAREAQVEVLKKFATLPEKMWEQRRVDGEVYPHEREWALQTKAQLLRDRAWVNRYLDGSGPEAAQMVHITLILSSPVKDLTKGA